ncbi:hypothetical protein FDUTEX481_00301 [Tolypothrix sp. PCC 7601]|nr:hypothetical protein FDUTEX481_00301 [Tolypothrix sp. PCC 7601]
MGKMRSQGEKVKRKKGTNNEHPLPITHYPVPKHTTYHSITLWGYFENCSRQFC